MKPDASIAPPRLLEVGLVDGGLEKGGKEREGGGKVYSRGQAKGVLLAV